MKTLALSLLAFTLVSAQPAANLTGKWAGPFVTTGPDGSTQEQGIELNLTHKGKEVTGTVGPNADRQWTVSKGLVDGNKLTFQVQIPDGPMISFALTFTNDRLVGEAVGEEDGRTLTAKIDAARAR